MAHETMLRDDAALREIITQQATGSCDFPDESRDFLLDQIQARHGSNLLAVLIYGSYLRGKRDTLLDFYVLLDSYGPLTGWWQRSLARALPPNVYHLQYGNPPSEIRSKYAVLTLDRFELAARRDFHSYFWARFAQPCGILYFRDDTVRERVISALCYSVATFARYVAPGMPDRFNTNHLWSKGLSLTYQCELRSEPPQHADRLFEFWPEYYRSVTSALAGQELGFATGDGPDEFRNTTPSRARRWSGFTWSLRRLQGKLLSVLRIVKAAVTFDGALDYLLWKIQRHSGIYIEPTGLQRQYPLIFAWPLLFRLWREGAFR
jgi:hypothetical protein